jgi:hypothetical protein
MIALADSIADMASEFMCFALARGFVGSLDCVFIAYLRPKISCALHVLLRPAQFFGYPTKLLRPTISPRGEDASPLLFRRMSRVPIFRFALLASLFEFK